jgi:NADH-quinone oxidoreductase subunit G
MTSVDETPDTVSFTVNGADVAAAPGALIIDACDAAGVHIPRFCHHERMNPVGMCRMCLVEVDTGRGPALSPSCMLTVAEGMVVETESDATKKAQDGVLEFLLINHPLDCPICDKGGECPLQDQTMAFGPGESRFIEEKRHFTKPIPINDNVYLDRERCILCDRCTRFADEVVGDPLIHFISRGNQTQVNTFPDEPFASYFSGNVVQICPVGALTAKPYRFKARPWDLTETESTYPNPMGDRISVESSRDQVLRIQGVDSDAVNWGWLADKDRFSFQAMESEHRISAPLVRGGGLNEADADGDELVASAWSSALGMVVDALRDADPERVAVLGGARLSNEAQYAWTKLAKGVIGTDNVDASLGDDLPVHALLGLPRATIDEVCAPGAKVILLGPDPKESHGTLYIRLRHAAREGHIELIELTPVGTGLSGLAAARLHPRPGEVGRVAKALASDDPTGEVGGVSADAISAAKALLDGGPVYVVGGRASMAESAEPTIAALTPLSRIAGCRFLPLVHRGNLMGALDMGMAPGLLPGRNTLASGTSAFAGVWATVPGTAGMDAAAILAAAAAGDIDTLILLGSDPVTDGFDADLAREALAKAGTVVAVDLFVNQSVALADVVLPAAAFTEADGSHTNIEGRITAIRAQVTAPGTARSDWMIAAEIAERLGSDLGFDEAGDVWAELAPLSAVHADVTPDAIRAERDGLLVAASGRVAFEPLEGELEIDPLDGYALRLVAARRMYGQGTLVQESSSLAGLAARTQLRLNEYDFNRLGVQAGEAVDVESSAGTMSLPAVADGLVPRGVALVDYNRAGADVRRLFDGRALAGDVRLDASGSSSR